MVMLPTHGVFEMIHSLFSTLHSGGKVPNGRMKTPADFVEVAGWIEEKNNLKIASVRGRQDLSSTYIIRPVNLRNTEAESPSRGAKGQGAEGKGS